MKYLSFFDLTNNKIEKDAKYSEIINQIKQLKESERKDISILSKIYFLFKNYFENFIYFIYETIIFFFISKYCIE